MKNLCDTMSGVTRLNTHMCCFRLVDPVSGLRMRKSMRFLNNMPSGSMKDVIKTCTRDNEHETIIGSANAFGSRAVVSQVYPMPFCKAVASAVCTVLHGCSSLVAPPPSDQRTCDPGGVPHPGEDRESRTDERERADHGES